MTFRIYFCFDETPATFTTWYIEEEFVLYKDYYIKTDKIPECIYIPTEEYYYGFNYAYKAKEHKDFFSNMFSVKEERGTAGYFLYVDN